jgi:hypothetical protein
MSIMNEDKIDKKIKLSYDLPLIILIVGIIISVWIFAIGLYGLFKLDFSIFNIISLIFLILAIFLFDNLLHLANAELDDNYVYLKGLFFSKKVDLINIDSVKQKKWRLRNNYEPLISIKTGNNNHIIKRYYIIPNNVSFDKKVDNRIFNLLNDYVLKVKNINAR